MKRFEVRVTNTKDQNYLKNYIYKYRHWQNILTTLTINLFKADNSNYKHFLDCAVVRACVADTKGDKKKVETIAYIKEKYYTTKLFFNGKRTKRVLFKDTIINKIFNADLNGAVNHIQLAIKKSFQWLKDNLWKLCNPIKVKSAGELHSLLCV
jgi:hypothetical protein